MEQVAEQAEALAAEEGMAHPLVRAVVQVVVQAVVRAVVQEPELGTTAAHTAAVEHTGFASDVQPSSSQRN